MKAKVTINITYDVSSPEEIQESFQSAASHLALNGLMGPESEKQTPSIWVVVYEHRHGVDAWPVVAMEEPSEEELIASLEEWEPDRGETIEVVGPWDFSGNPTDRHGNPVDTSSNPPESESESE